MIGSGQRTVRLYTHVCSDRHLHKVWPLAWRATLDYLHHMTSMRYREIRDMPPPTTIPKRPPLQKDTHTHISPGPMISPPSHPHRDRGRTRSLVTGNEAEPTTHVLGALTVLEDLTHSQVLSTGHEWPKAPLDLRAGRVRRRSSRRREGVVTHREKKERKDVKYN